MNSQMRQEFASPSSEYRAKPFWSWNGKLEEPELRRQIRVMRKMGLGGFFMHSRVGLATPYLSEEWFRLVNACADEARTLGMEAWLYDEDRWPSGAAGGLVTRNPKYRMRSLCCTRLRSPRKLEWGPSVLAAFTAKIAGSAATEVRRLRRRKRPARLGRGQSILVFEVKVDDCSNWYNGYTYLDTLSHEAVRRFIKATHQAYAKKSGRYFGKTVPGIFTDEPNYGGVMAFRDGAYSVPWTARLPAVFRKRYGYDLIPHLPEIFYDVNGRAVTPARWNYHDCITFLFVDAFARQIGEWCGKNGIQHTGHVLSEDSLSSQTRMVGSAMRFYEHMQAPGMDLLTEHWRIYDTAKQVSSAARQFGRKWRLTETYGCTGWDFPFAGHKALSDWQTALGINLRCPHLSWYTMGGEAKRDYPAGIFYQSPWWELYPKVEDYFSRVGVVMTRGEEVRDLLVIHPIESMWMLARIGWEKLPETKRLDRTLQDLRNTLLSGHVDFDYGEEEILSRHGRVRRAGGRPVVTVGKAAYRAIVVPPMLTMRRSTLDLLKRFRKAGGTVVFAGEPAAHVDARPSDDAAAFANACRRTPAKGAVLVKAVEAECRRISIRDAAGREIPPALYLLREDADAFYLFVCNTGHSPAQFRLDQMSDVLARDRAAAWPEVRIRGFAACRGAPEEWDAETARVYAANARRARSGEWEIRTSLPALASRVFVIPKAGARSALPACPAYREVRSAALARKTWDAGLSEENVLVLDRPRYRIGGGAWQKETEILRVDRAVRDRLGVPRRGGGMCQPWAQKPAKDAKSARLELVYRFNIETAPTGRLDLALEHPDRFQVYVNGVAISRDSDSGWWTDLSLRRLPVDPAILHAGRNEICLVCDYNQTHGLEIAYLLGNFGTRVKGAKITMTRPVSHLRIGDWVKQGLAFYSGHVTYQTEIRPRRRKGERIFVEVPAYRGVAVHVLVNGRSAGVIAWEPHEVDITDLLTQGPAHLAIQVIGHRRNSHGPLHLNQKWPVWTGPDQFVTEGEEWQEEYQLVPCGLMRDPLLVVKRQGR